MKIKDIKTKEEKISIDEHKRLLSKQKKQIFKMIENNYTIVNQVYGSYKSISEAKIDIIKKRCEWL